MDEVGFWQLIDSASASGCSTSDADALKLRSLTERMAFAMRYHERRATLGDAAPPHLVSPALHALIDDARHATVGEIRTALVGAMCPIDEAERLADGAPAVYDRDDGVGFIVGASVVFFGQHRAGPTTDGPHAVQREDRLRRSRSDRASEIRRRRRDRETVAGPDPRPLRR